MLGESGGGRTERSQPGGFLAFVRGPQALWILGQAVQRTHTLARAAAAAPNRRCQT